MAAIDWYTVSIEHNNVEQERIILSDILTH